jgi:hypothetical protein
VTGDAFAEGGASAPPVCHPASVIGGWVVAATSPDYPLFQAAGEALSIVALRSAAKVAGDRATWKELRGRQNPLLVFVSKTPAATLEGAALKLRLVIHAAETGAQSSRDLRMVRDALAVIRGRSDRRYRRPEWLSNAAHRTKARNVGTGQPFSRQKLCHRWEGCLAYEIALRRLAVGCVSIAWNAVAQTVPSTPLEAFPSPYVVPQPADINPSRSTASIDCLTNFSAPSNLDVCPYGRDEQDVHSDNPPFVHGHARCSSLCISLVIVSTPRAPTGLHSTSGRDGSRS